MTTHLVHVPLDMDALRRWALARGLVGRAPFDAGYSLHVLLSAMFGKSVLQPFRIFASARRRVAALYAYAETDAAALRQVASLAATPDWLAVLDPGELRTKLMPESFASDQRLGFDVRVRPVRRSQRDCPGRRPPQGVRLRHAAAASAEDLTGPRRGLDAAQRGPDRDRRVQCEQAHYAAEFAIKGVIIAHGADFETTHDIGALLDRARDTGESIPAAVEEAAALSRYAGSGRYEFDTDAESVEITERDLQQALKRGRAAVEWAEDRIQGILEE